MNGNGNGIKVPPHFLLVLLQGVSVVLLGIGGWLFTGIYEQTHEINHQVIEMQTKIQMIERIQDRNTQKIDDLTQKVYERTP